MGSINRRDFIKSTAGSLGALSIAGQNSHIALGQENGQSGKSDYQGPNIIVVRFGGGVRRSETIVEAGTHCPFFLHELCKQGTLYTNMELSDLNGVETSHGQGTLYNLTGKYDKYEDVGQRFLGQRFEPRVPTFFEYFRKAYNVPAHQTLIVNGEDRTDEEFYTFSNHHLFGTNFRSNVLSLYRYKVYLLRRQIEEGKFKDEELEKKKAELEKLETIDYRTGGDDEQNMALQNFWEHWRGYYGESGLVNPRGDALLTELSLRAMERLRPRMLMINYNDPDYVHWGNPSHYTRGIAVIDRGIERLYRWINADPFYAGNTVMVVVPDCGRDSNPFVAVPFQHHFNSKSAHEIFALLVGPGIKKNQRIDKPVDQVNIAPTIGALTSMKTGLTEGDVLEDALA